jgi:diacylglycerol kinase family enzyme
MGLGMNSTLGRIVCIMNEAAGSNGAGTLKNELEKLFAERGADVEIILAREGNDIAKIAARAVEDRCARLLAAGGDGTLNAVASALVGTETALGILPLGTLNHFAKDLNIPLALRDAVATALDGTALRVDVGEVNGRIFLNNSSLGLYPGLVVQRENLQRTGLSKWTAFSRALVYSFWRYSGLTVRLEADGDRQIVASTPFVFVGNNRYEICAPHMGERTCLNEGRLWLYQAPHAGRLRLFGVALRALLGFADAAELNEQAIEEFWIYTRARRLHVATDGEVTTMATPLHYRIVPRSLVVLVPQAPATLDKA